MPSLFLVHITLQFNRLPHSRTFYSRQSVISYFNIQVLRKNVTGYNVLWRNHYEDGYWSQDTHCNGPQPFEFWLTWTLW